MVSKLVACQVFKNKKTLNNFEYCAKMRLNFRKMKLMVPRNCGYGVFENCHIGSKGESLTHWEVPNICLYI